MPYRLEQEKGGYVVVSTNTGVRHSKKPIPKSRAEAQMRLLYAIESGNFKPRDK
jgi:hypothetical protein